MDKTMAEKLMYIPIMIHKMTPTVDYNYSFGTFGHSPK